MSITVNTLNNRLSTYLRHHLPESALNALTNTEYVQYYNDVARDLNRIAHIWKQRYYKETGSNNSEDDNYTNYLVQDKILKILHFKYYDSTYPDQCYTFEDDRIVLKESPDSGIDMDIYYIRDTRDVSDLTDEIDLPNSVISDFEQLIKVKLRIDYGGFTDIDYETLLNQFAVKADKGINQNFRTQVKRSWFEQDDDDFLYDMTNNYISLENFSVGDDGNYNYIGGND